MSTNRKKYIIYYDTFLSCLKSNKNDNFALFVYLLDSVQNYNEL